MSLAPPRVLHVVVGPDEHGVVRHGVEVARAAGDRVVRLDRPGPVAPDLLAGVDVVHLPFTDRLFAPRCEDAADAFADLVDPLRRAGLAVSVTLHDLPAGDDDLQVRRRAAYARVVGGCAGVVVNSRRELALVAELDEHARSLRMVPLPVDPVPRPTEPPAARWARPTDVVVLGFLFPDRGYEQVLDALPPAADLLALGRPSAGHDDLPPRYAERAAAGGRSFRVSGFVADDDLAAELWAAGVPVAPNRRVAASGSIGTWVAHGRRPLVPGTAYTRELVARWPGALTLYDADDPTGPGSLAAALGRAVDDPTSTWLDDPEVVGPRLSEVVAAYVHHFRGCGPERAVALTGRRVVVPGNRWDLVGTAPARETAVSVVVPYHRDQAGLDLVLTALTLQDHPDLEVVVADDGSPEPPTLAAAGDLPVTLVRQERRGFRAAAARNLGARAANGDVLVFLDGDTVPEPAYVSNLVRLPARCPDALVVGRRRHADLGGWSPARLRSWLTGEPGAEPPAELSEPGWLRDAYAASADLLTADARSYRYVISAVMGLSRALFGEVGGFDERFEAYGGEDWELAHRLRSAGAVLAHVPTAVAWHDGPDWAGRSEAGPGSKNAELLALSRLLPDPALRGGGTWALPAVVVELAFDEPAAVLATARAAFAGGTDGGVWVVGDPERSAATVALLDDARVHLGPVPAEVADRAVATVHVTLPTRLLDLAGLVAAAETYGSVSAPGVTVTPTRVARRARRWGEVLGEVPADLALRLFGGRDVLGPVVTGGPGRVVDLGHELTMVGRWAGVSP